MSATLTTDWGDALDARYFLADELKKIHGKRVLDAACNQGALLSCVPTDNERAGFDINPSAVTLAKSRARGATITQGSLYDIPYPSRSFDVVIAANVVPGADFPTPADQTTALQQKSVAELARVLKPSGVLYFTTPNNARYHTVKLTRDDVQRLLTPHFTLDVSAYNPFPDFPYFIPARVLARVPGWRWLLNVLCETHVGVNRGKTFYVKATRR